MTARGVRLANERPPRNRGTREQARALDRFLRGAEVRGTPGVVPAEKCGAVLGAIAAHVDGAGYAYLEVETLIAESGVRRRIVFRALAALERDGWVERIPTKRTKGGRGQGATTYRLGAAVRAAVGLRETDWAPEVAPAIPTAENGSLAHPGTDPAGGTGTPGETLTGTPGNGDRPAAPTGTPGPNPLAHPDEQEESALDARSTGTPERLNGGNPSPTTPDVELLPADVDLAGAREDTGHPCDRLLAELPDAFPDAREVTLDLHDWTTKATGRYGTLDLRSPRNGGDPLDVTCSGAGFGNTPGAGAREAA